MITMHPGEYLTVAYLEPLKLSQREVASRLGVSTAAISRLVAGRADLSPEMAVRLSYVFGRSAESWMSMQVGHSLRKAREALDPAAFQRIEFPDPEEDESESES